MAQPRPERFAPLGVAHYPVPASPTAPAKARSGEGLAPSEALSKLGRAIKAFKAEAVRPMLAEAIEHTRLERYREGAALCLQALDVDDQCAIAWHMLAICREKAGDFTGSLKCYDTALKLDPDDPEIAYNLGHLAFRMDMKEVAEKLFRQYLLLEPNSPQGANNLACALRDQMRFAEAIELIRATIYAHPDLAILWNTLATILTEQGEMQQAVTFFDEALRLNPDFAKARYNRANARHSIGDPAGALSDCEAAIPGVRLESEVATMRFARSNMLLAAGDLERGWEAYEARLDPHHADVTHFLIDRPRWTPDSDLQGRSLLLIGEQGLGDEVMFANILPDVSRALGPQGRLSLAVETRLVPLFQRSFPEALVGAHTSGRVDHHSVRLATFVGDAAEIDLWSPLASPLRRFRRTAKSFPQHAGYLKPNAQRVESWRNALAALGPGPKVGLVWKSLKINSARLRYFTPFQQWAPLLATPGARFVNLQYGDCADELTLTRDTLGVEIWNPPGLDLKDDLDEVASLVCALDLTIGPANATTNIAGACGAPLWLISTPGSWTSLGTDGYPWYPQARVFSPPAFNDWDPAVDEMAKALSELCWGPEDSIQ